ncbi:MAG: hypothetical protein REI11_13085 [Patulibacter sp.]|nr:hypothetical protein [Patulibacter sp.]
MANILVYALAHEGKVNKNSLGAVSEAASLAGELGGAAHAVVVGTDVSGLPEQLGSAGASRVWTTNAPEGSPATPNDAIAALG